MSRLSLSGEIPAHLMTYDDDLAIDESELRSHVTQLAATEGVTAITTNGHAAEVSSLTHDEQRRALSIVVDEVGGSVSIICGVAENGTDSAREVARAAEGEGADALLIFPSEVMALGGSYRPEVAYHYYESIAEATSLPLVIFQYPVDSGVHLETDLLVKICSEIDNVVAVKEWSSDIVTYERNYRALKAIPKGVNVLSAYSMALLASLVVGADGILSGHGSMIASEQAMMLKAVSEGDLAGARRIADQINPIVRACYANPLLDMHNRMKEANVMLGRLRKAHVRPPLQAITAAERDALREAVHASELPASRPVARRTR